MSSIDSKFDTISKFYKRDFKKLDVARSQTEEYLY